MKTRRPVPDWLHALPAFFIGLLALTFAFGWWDVAALRINQLLLGGHERQGGAGGSALEQSGVHLDSESPGRAPLPSRGELATPIDRGGTRQRRRGGAGGGGR